MLIYVGKGFIPGIPARDLTDEEIEKGGWDAAKLVKSGLYAMPEMRKALRKRHEDKAIWPTIQDKER